MKCRSYMKRAGDTYDKGQRSMYESQLDTMSWQEPASGNLLPV